MRPRGHIIEPAVLGGFGGGNPDIHTDIAFQGKFAYQGNWDGFNIRDIRSANNPRTVSRTFCDGNQGDIVVYKDILVRAWNTPAGTAGAFGAGLTCDGQPVPAGFEGVHVFDISDKSDPELVADIELSARPGADTFGCGSHTLTLVPDLRDDRVLVYNQTSGGPCPFVSILEVPLDAPEDASFLRNEPLEEADAAHDTGVILGKANLMAVASHDHANVYDIGRNQFPGGSPEDPEFLYHITEPGVCNVPGDPNCNGNWHSAAFTWDGEVIIMGWEPGGGLQAECEASDPAAKKSFFFYDADDGSKLGQWTLPRPQGANENCTLHNYNLIPLRDGRDILVSGNYQAGIWVVDLTDPANARTVAWSDPPPAAPVSFPPGTPPFCSTVPQGCPLTGAWSGYWYNGYIYESHIGEGLNIFKLKGRETRSAVKLSHLNPQTQEFTLDSRRGDDDDDDHKSKRRGLFRTLPAGTAMGLRIGGFAQITRSARGTDVSALVAGLEPRMTYGAHLHNAPCSAPDPGGAHYKHDPAGPSMPPNELWLSTSGDPMAGITSNAAGIAFGRGSADWVARPEAQSVVIHAIPPGGTPAGGPKIACADLLR